MENRLKYIEELMQSPLGPDDSFSFRCRQCGECCRDREDILLSPFDICRIAKQIDAEPFEVIQKYGTVYIGHTSKVPLVSLKMRDDTGECPFLKDNRCSIQMSKPSVCALYPLGRTVSIDAESESADVSYILQPVSCGANDESHTPIEWLGEFGLEESEEWFLVWQDTVIGLCERISTLLPKLPGSIPDEMYSGLMEILYMRYHPEDPLFPQVIENRDMARRLLDSIEDMIRQYMG